MRQDRYRKDGVCTRLQPGWYAHARERAGRARDFERKGYTMSAKKPSKSLQAAIKRERASLQKKLRIAKEDHRRALKKQLAEVRESFRRGLRLELHALRVQAKSRIADLLEGAKTEKKRAATRSAEVKRKADLPKTEKKRAATAQVLSDAELAAQIQRVASEPGVAKFHDDRAFIASVYDHMPKAQRRTLEQFKQVIINLHRLRLLRLSSADLVQAMDPTMVARSETRYLSATFHFATFHFIAIPAPSSKSEDNGAREIARRVRVAYRALRKETGLRNVLISDIAKRSAVPLDALHAYLAAECYQDRANPSLGEPTAATAAQLRAALPIAGQPHLYIELYDDTHEKGAR